MKKIVLYFLISLVNFSNTFSQSESEEIIKNNLVSKYKLDFAVPDIPAIKVLGIDKSKLLKPSFNDILSLITADILNLSNFSLPKSYAAEVSPILIINQYKSVSQYTSAIYSLRISFATSRSDTESSNKIALGIRSTLIDRGNLIEDPKYQEKIKNLLFDYTVIKKKYEDEYDEAYKDVMDLKKKEWRDKKNNYVDKKMNENIETIFDERLDKLKEEYTKKNWNKLKWDIAYALSGQSTDSLLKNLKFTGHSFWTTLAVGPTSWSQNLLGLNFIYNSSTKKYEVNINDRLYIGVNKAKGFLEVQLKGREKEKSNLFFNLGAELNLIAGIWATYYAGLDINDLGSNSTSKFESHFDLRYTLP